MKLAREEFLRVLSYVEPGLADREILDQSKHFVFRKGRVMTFNEEVACRVPSGLGKEVIGAVPAKPLLDLLRKLTEEDIDVSFTDEGLTIKGTAKRSLVRMDKEITLPVNLIEDPGEWRKLPPDFCEAVSVVGSCAGRNALVFIKTCVHIHPKWVEASDGMQFCRWRLKTGVESSVLVRQQSVKDITSLGMTEVSETSAWLHFKNPAGLVLSCRKYMEEFEDITEHLKFQGTPVSLPKGLSEAAEKAAVFSADNPESDLVRIDLSQGRLKIKGEGTHGWYSESKKTSYEGEPLSFYASPALLADLVKRHTQYVVSKDLLKVEGDRYVFAACLVRPDERGAEETNGVAATEEKE